MKKKDAYGFENEFAKADAYEHDADDEAAEAED